VPGQEVAEHLNLHGNKREEFLKQLNKDKVPVKAARRASF
jgi:hypothetical protein